MSGDVQPRKRKDKKKKKDDLGVEEPRGTAATFGEGDVFMHSQHDHGTGGHWCAKIIFFSLLAVLLTLIGLIILENRGLSELEANSIESRYSGVLEGWIEDAPDDDHHDEHTLELTHPDEEEHNEDDDEEHDTEIEVEKIEEEPSDLEPINTGLPALPEQDDDDDTKEDDQDENLSKEDDSQGDNDSQEDEDDEFLDNDDKIPPVVEHVTAPSGKLFKEVEDEDSKEELPVDTLAEEEEYEKRQEELRKEQEEASHMWLKLGVGGALLLATHAVLRRAVTPRDEADVEDDIVRDATPDRRMTLIPEKITPPVMERPVASEPLQHRVKEELVKKIPAIIESAPTPKQVSMEDQDEADFEEELVDEEELLPEILDDNKELYSDQEEEEDQEVVQDKEQEVEEKDEQEEDVSDVEIIGEEELQEEGEEEEISDVDDAELLSRLEAKYGRLPEPERPQPKHKGGGNSVEDIWPGEPSDAFWREQLDSAEHQLRQDWLE